MSSVQPSSPSIRPLPILRSLNLPLKSPPRLCRARPRLPRARLAWSISASTPRISRAPSPPPLAPRLPPSKSPSNPQPNRSKHLPNLPPNQLRSPLLLVKPSFRVPTKTLSDFNPAPPNPPNLPKLPNPLPSQPRPNPPPQKPSLHPRPLPLPNLTPSKPSPLKSSSTLITPTCRS